MVTKGLTNARLSRHKPFAMTNQLSLSDSGKARFRAEEAARVNNWRWWRDDRVAGQPGPAVVLAG